jgi:uncharacterized protein YjcR
MKELNIKRATNRYNDIMEVLGYDENTIGTWLSESTDGWNIRDMVAECSYILSTYYEEGHTNHELKEYDHKMWVSQVGKLKRFIATYKPFINGVKCVCRHCSIYDNK